MMSLGSGSDGSQSAGNLLKPYLSRGDLQVIGATTNEEYVKYILADKAFASRLTKVALEK